MMVLGLLALASAKLAAQNIAFVNEGKLLAALPGYTHATKQMDSVQKVYSTEISQKTADLDQRVQSLLQNYKVSTQTTATQLQAMLNEADKKKLALLQEESELLKKQLALKQEEYNAMYQKTVGPITAKANKIIQEHCKANKIEALFKTGRGQPNPVVLQ